MNIPKKNNGYKIAQKGVWLWLEDDFVHEIATKKTQQEFGILTFKYLEIPASSWIYSPASNGGDP